jgi:hypothetical protein
MAGADPMLLLRKSAELVGLDPFSVVQAFAGPIFIGIIVFFCADSRQ